MLWLLIASVVLIYGITGLAGGLIPENWLARHRDGLVAFAAGAMLAAAFIDILPEVVDTLGGKGLIDAFAGFLGAMLLDVLMAGRKSKGRPANLALLIADGLHNAGDGAAITAAFLVSIPLGVTVATAMIAHELPQEVGDYAVLRALGWSRRRALTALAGVQLTAGVGAAGVGLATNFSGAAAVVLAIAAGTLIHLGATDLLPTVEAAGPPAKRIRAMLAFLLGVGVIAVARAAGG